MSALTALLPFGWATPLEAQFRSYTPPETHGLHSALALGALRLSLDGDGTRTMPTLGIDLGWRVRLPCCRSQRPVSITPLFGIQVTSIQGVRDGSDDVSFASITPGVQLAARISKLRPFVTWRSGKRTMERFDRLAGADTLVASDYAGDGRSIALGVEIPAPWRRWGEGFQISVARVEGHFTTVERSGEDYRARLPFRASIVNVAWSGRLRGTSKLFAP